MEGNKKSSKAFENVEINDVIKRYVSLPEIAMEEER